jgi:hypothetical protein
LRFSTSPRTSFGAWPAASTALASSVAVVPWRRSASASSPSRKHLRRLRRPLAGAVHGGRRAAVALLLQRVGQRQREQAADRVVAAGVDQALDPFGAQQAARRVVHQHPVVGAHAARGEPLQAGRHGGGAGRAAAALDPGARAGEVRHVDVRRPRPPARAPPA